MCDQRSLHLPCSAASVGQARRFLDQALREWGFTPDLPARPPPSDHAAGGGGGGAEKAEAREVLLLVGSELTANAARFCHAELVLTVDGHRDAVRLTVTDDAPAPAIRRQVAPDATSGRGLAIVAELATTWGQRPFGAGTKDVWAEIAFPPSALSLSCTH